MHRRVILLSIVALLAGCGVLPDPFPDTCTEADGVDSVPLRSRADKQQDRWSRERPERYTVYSFASCFCGPNWALTAVSGETITASVSPLESYTTHRPWRMEDFFDDIRTVAKRRPAELSVSYDEALGYPTRYFVEPSVCWLDDEYSAHVAIVSPPVIAGVSGASLCTAAAVRGLAGKWQVESAPAWELAVSPVTAQVTVLPATYSTQVSEATVRLYDVQGRSTRVTVALTPFPLEPWCGASIQYENIETYLPRKIFAVLSDERLVLWDPNVFEQPGSRAAQWRFAR